VTEQERGYKWMVMEMKRSRSEGGLDHYSTMPQKQQQLSLQSIIRSSTIIIVVIIIQAWTSAF